MLRHEHSLLSDFCRIYWLKEKNAAQKLEEFHGDCHVRGWLCQIAKNTYYNYAKKKSGFVELKEVFSLRIFGELSFSDIGELFGKSDGWARVTFHRAGLMIKEEMETIKGEVNKDLLPLYVEDSTLRTKELYYCYYSYDVPEDATLFVYLATTLYESNKEQGKVVMVDGLSREYIITDDESEKEEVTRTELKRVYYVSKENVQA